MDFIMTWDTYFNKEDDRWQNIRRRALKSGVILPLGETIDIGESVVPTINHGRWIVGCPWCNSASYAREDELFFCENCFNAQVGRCHIKAPFPQKRKQIEAKLVARLNPENRNWEHETLKKLTDENKEHGVE